MPSNFTENYSLSQWERTDQVRMEDFNADNAKIDAALKAEADARTALAAEVAKLGNCRIGVQSYTGTGTYGSANPTTVTFAVKPVMCIITGWSALAICFRDFREAQIYYSYPDGASSVVCTWEGTRLSFSHSDAVHQLNENNRLYCVVAFYAEDEA